MLKQTVASILLATIAGLAIPASAHDYKLGQLEIIHPWARASIGQAKAGVAYVTISNEGREPDRLIATATDVAKRAALHTNKMENGVMLMLPVEAIELAPGEPVVLEPGGLHIMLMGLKSPLVEGDSFPLTLTFEKAGSIEVEVNIQEATDMVPGTHDHSGS